MGNRAYSLPECSLVFVVFLRRPLESLSNPKPPGRPPQPAAPTGRFGSHSLSVSGPPRQLYALAPQDAQQELYKGLVAVEAALCALAPAQDAGPEARLAALTQGPGWVTPRDFGACVGLAGGSVSCGAMRPSSL